LMVCVCVYVWRRRKEGALPYLKTLVLVDVREVVLCACYILCVCACLLVCVCVRICAGVFFVQICSRLCPSLCTSLVCVCVCVCVLPA
jgi:hypothetical protein